MTAGGSGVPWFEKKVRTKWGLRKSASRRPQGHRLHRKKKPGKTQKKRKKN